MFINNTIMLLQQADGASRGAPEGSCLELFTVLLIFGCIFYFGRVTFLHQLVLCCVDFFLLMKSQSSVSNIRNITLSTSFCLKCLKALFTVFIQISFTEFESQYPLSQISERSF